MASSKFICFFKVFQPHKVIASQTLAVCVSVALLSRGLEPLSNWLSKMVRKICMNMSVLVYLFCLNKSIS